MKAMVACAVLTLVVSVAAQGGEHRLTSSRQVVIADGGKACLPVVISSNATPQVKRYADELAAILSRMGGAAFAVVTNDGSSGIAVGVVGDFAGVSFQPEFKLADPGERQGYEIKTHRRGVYVMGATGQAVGYAVYDFLYRLGYRRYFPGEDWEIIPAGNTLRLAAHIRETPDYFTRAIWFSMGVWPEYTASLEQWITANRNGGYPLSIAHMYQRIIQENQRAFDEHPEYYGLVNGKRTSSKMCISNPGLRKLVADHVVNQFAMNPALECVSVEASDGGGWCECRECSALGTPSTRVVTLANAVARAVRERFPGKYVGICAYGYHSPPPAIDVEDGVLVCACAGFIRGGYTLDTMLDGWISRRATAGVYDYYDVILWSANMPGLSRASNINYLKTTMPDFYKRGVRFLTAESSDSWGANGLGYYLADRLLWNVQEAAGAEQLIQDFMDKCFGPASRTMREFYTLIDGSQSRLLSPDLLGRMYRSLDRAMTLAAARPDVQRRIGDLALYVRFCELYALYGRAPQAERLKAYEQVMEFAASIKNTRMIHSKAFFHDRRLFAVKPESVPGDWKAWHDYTPEQVAGIISNGIASNRLLEFKPVRFSDDLVPASFLEKEVFTGGGISPRQGSLTLYVWADETLEPLDLAVTGGLIKWYRDRGNVKCELWKIGGASEEGDRESLVQTDASVSPDGVARVVRLGFKQSGLHKVVITDGGDLTKVEWPRGKRVTLLADTVAHGNVHGTYCFYVPRNTRTLGFECNARQGEIRSPDGKVAFRFNASVGHYSVPVGTGMDGKLWTVSILGNISLMTVPPCLAIEPAGLLLPQELVDLRRAR